MAGNWLEPMIEAFNKFQEVGIVGNVQRLADSSKYDHMGVVFSPEGNPRHFGQGFAYRPFKGQIRKWSAGTAACCLVRRDYFQQIGGLDCTPITGEITYGLERLAMLIQKKETIFELNWNNNGISYKDIC